MSFLLVASIFAAVFTWDNEKVQVEPLTSELFRVRVSEQGVFGESLLNRYGILKDDFTGTEAPSADFTFDSVKGELSFTSKISPAAFSVTFMRGEQGKREIDFSLKDGERVYGLGDLSRANLMRRPGRYELKVRNNAANIPIPMMMSHEGWGMLLNSTWYGYLDVGAKNPKVAAFELDGGAMDFYVFFGKDYRSMLDTYTKLTGRAKLLPAFGYGISYVCNQHIDQFNLINDAVRFREFGFPCDVLGLEPGWMETFYDKTVHKRFNRDRFSFPFWAPTASFTWPNALKRMGFNLSLWLCCNYDLTRYEEDCLKGKRVADKASEGGQLKNAVWEDNRITGVKNPKLKYPFGIEGKEVIERAVEDEFPEGTLPWFEHLKKFVDRGARCFKLDGANQLCPSKREWANGRPHEEVRNSYPVIYAKQMSQGYEDYTGRRAMVYSSGGWAGIQQFVATWAGDTGGGLGSLVSIMNLGMSGHSNQTCDMDVDDVTSLHYGIFQPWSQLASWDGWMMPWLFKKDYQDTIRNYWQLRYRLFPYLYTAAAHTARTGYPMVRMLPLEYPEVEDYDRVMTTYLLGDSLLVSAFTNTTVIPPGVWYDYRTGEKVTGPCVREECLSSSWGGGLYVKAGAVVPTWPQPEFIEKGWNEKVVLHVWPGDGESELYEDDGDSLGYVKGEHSRTPLKVTRKDGNVHLTIGPRRGTFKGMPKTRDFTVRLHLEGGRTKDVEIGSVGDFGEFDIAVYDVVPMPREIKEREGLAGPRTDRKFKSDSSLPPEGYILEITPEMINITAADRSGELYAVKTLEQLQYPNGWYPLVTVKDWPQYRWRGLLNDDSRLFTGVEFTKKLLDWMYEYKLNVFHWHLVDDQGWRVPSDAFPRLNTVGACGMGGYTKEQIAEIRQYAAQRGITIVPEIELPGHSQEVVRAYPELYCEGADPTAYDEMNCIGLCLGKDATIRFFEKTIDEFCELFPDSPYIHIGGDECPRENWKKCKDCQRRIIECGLRDEDELQSWCTKHFVRYLTAKGRKVIAWDEVIKGGLADGVGIMSWNGMAGGRQAAAHGNEVVMCPVVPCYFNYPQSLKDDWCEYPEAEWVKEISLKRVYAFDPCMKVPAADRGRILGSQCCLWTERSRNTQQIEWKLFPRLFAISEVMWTGDARPGVANFLPRAAVQRERMVERGARAAPVK